MNLGVQYYRPPFPDPKYWEDDFARIRDSGLNTVQLWVIWAWVEAKPGVFQFDDYDRLVALAEKNGLGVILSTVAEVQPYWILGEVPGCELVDHRGRKIVSANRCECHFGITPGGCTDHPGVWERMRRFLVEVATRYRSAGALSGWDAWNELRWNVHADSPVCYCEHTKGAFREWLDRKYGGLEGLNRAWNRRYGSWDEVDPGRRARSPYTEMMAFEHFLTWRANQHGKARYEVLKGIDPRRPVTVHGAAPSVLMPGDRWNQAVNRGNDWFFAEDCDGVGCSSFPKWTGMDDADFGLRVEAVRSAACGKRVWLSEVQGGRAATGFNVHEPVDARSQQRWIWNGIACGADTILFWCWRDEVFGYESAGFGIAGADGLAQERLSAMKVTGRLLQTHRRLIANYQPAAPQVGLLFSPQSYYLAWADEATAGRPMQALVGYARALTRRSIPYLFVEEEHLDALDGLEVLFLPRAIVTDEAAEEALMRFVEGGGTLVCESECGAFGSNGLYRYPVDRFTARPAGIREIGRRSLTGDTLKAQVDGRELNLGVTQWLTPWQRGKGRVIADGEEGPLIVEVPVGKGKFILCGAYLGDAYTKRRTADFEVFLEALVRGAGWTPDVEVLRPQPEKDAFVYIKTGASAGKTVVFVFFPEGCDEVRLRMARNLFSSGQAAELISGADAALADTANGREVTLPATDIGIAVLVEP